jgi:hypothetical protein
MSIAPETLAWLRQTAAVDGAAYSQVLLHLLERVEGLEQRPIPGFVELATPTPEPAPVVTDEEVQKVLRAYDLGRQHGAAQPLAFPPPPPVAPAGGLVERVVKVIADPDGPAELWHDDARAAIREVAAWLDRYGGCHPCAVWLREEVDR